jgi:hypothetical protein
MKKMFAIVAAVVALAASGAAQQAWQTKQWTPHLIVAVTSGSTPAFVHSVTIVMSSDFAGTIDGKTVSGSAPGGAMSWRGTDEHTLGSMPYTRSAGTLYILYTQ